MLFLVHLKTKTEMSHIFLILTNLLSKVGIGLSVWSIEMA